MISKKDLNEIIEITLENLNIFSFMIVLPSLGVSCKYYLLRTKNIEIHFHYILFKCQCRVKLDSRRNDGRTIVEP